MPPETKRGWPQADPEQSQITGQHRVNQALDEIDSELTEIEKAQAAQAKKLRTKQVYKILDVADLGI